MGRRQAHTKTQHKGRGDTVDSQEQIKDFNSGLVSHDPNSGSATAPGSRCFIVINDPWCTFLSMSLQSLFLCFSPCLLRLQEHNHTIKQDAKQALPFSGDISFTFCHHPSRVKRVFCSRRRNVLSNVDTQKKNQTLECSICPSCSLPPFLCQLPPLLIA